MGRLQQRWTRVVLMALTAALAFSVGLTMGGLMGSLGLPVRLRAALAAGNPPAVAVLPAPANPDRPEDATAPQDPLRSRISLPPTATSTPQATPSQPATLVPVAPIVAIATLGPSSTATPAPMVAVNLPPLAESTSAPLFAEATTPRLALSGLRHEWQTWNNCGPATLATLLSNWGSPLTQADIGSILRRSPDDKNVSPDELVAYARAQGYRAHLRVNGNTALMRTLLANGYPVLIETWLEEHPNDGMGHYRLLTGYDDGLGGWIAYDSYVSSGLIAGGAKNGGEGAYAGILFSYAEMDTLWKVFNRTWLLVYPPADEALINAILAAHGSQSAIGDEAPMWAASETTARAETDANPADVFAWFNLGSTLWAQGRADEAAAAFDQARTIGLPWRMLWYQFAPFATYHAVGRDGDVLELANATLANSDSIEEVYYWQGVALQSLGDPVGARAAYERTLALAPSHAEAMLALNTLVQ